MHMNMTEISCNPKKVSFFQQDSQEIQFSQYIYQLLANFNEYYPGIPSEGDNKETNEGWKTNALGGLAESKANNILFKAMKPADHVAMKSGQQSNYY